MNRKKVGFIVISLLSALVFYQLYQNTIIHWDGYGVEVDIVTDVDSDMLIPIEPSGLQDYPVVASFLDEASEGGAVMVTEVMEMEQLYGFLRSKGLDLSAGYYYLEHDGETYSVSLVMYGGMDDQPIYIYLAGIMVVIAIGLTVEGLRSGKLI
ncbi:hypothetical protein HN807_09005 [Candidatus Bathyarchaeota archaeon]|jgi:hypothetical protein|nr:hypothetical protein [Candidatus Bathyarchaeota archaeon]MBT4319106.1 hypothetical protein [Candidatus Bathyarchaeota archaeon]MBT4423472.1 hypothetical protein [Candidatus Bathyarchaeota archaeon]MBT5642539.1 hypothetical protein [Candidatus Bathyarchaeota archaeon]MBT6605416.1 hypothetical protein [Candidatus Bathyarchaeota archaeon]